MTQQDDVDDTSAHGPSSGHTSSGHTSSGKPDVSEAPARRGQPLPDRDDRSGVEGTADPDDYDKGAADEKPAPTLLQRIRSFATELVIIVVLAMVFSALIRAFLGQVFIIPSGSMEDTLQIRDRVFVTKIGDIHRGDVVVFKDPGGWLPPAPEQPTANKVLQFLGVQPDASTQHLIKRAIGMPGDRVKCCDAQGRMTVNGQPLDETSYLESTDGVQDAPALVPFEVVVPAGHIFVMGDNRDNSADSRCHLADISIDGRPRGMTAFVPLDDVVGPAQQVIMPFDRFQRLKRPATFASVPDPTGPAPDKPTIIPEGVRCS